MSSPVEWEKLDSERSTGMEEEIGEIKKKKEF
jgi:hypothetical protein